MHNRLIKMLAGGIAIAAMTAFASPAWTQGSEDVAPSGAAYLTWNGQSSSAGNYAGGNGIPGPRQTWNDIPEPSSWALFGIGLGMVGLMRFASKNRG